MPNQKNIGHFEQEKSKNEDVPLLELNNLENKIEIESQLLEVSKANDNENGFLDFGFNQSILNSLRNKGFTRPSTNRHRKDCSFCITINRETCR